MWGRVLLLNAKLAICCCTKSTMRLDQTSVGEIEVICFSVYLQFYRKSLQIAGMPEKNMENMQNLLNWMS